MTLWYAWHEVGNDEVLKNSRVFSSPECIKGDSTLCIIICEAGIRIPRGDEKPSLLSSVQSEAQFTPAIMMIIVKKTRLWMIIMHCLRLIYCFYLYLVHQKKSCPVIRHLGPTLMMIRLNWYLHFIDFYTSKMSRDYSFVRIEKCLMNFPDCNKMRLSECFSNTVNNITLILQSFALQLLSKATVVKILDCSEGKVLPHFYCMCFF